MRTVGTEGEPHPTYRPDIDGLRAVSVLGVLLFHVGATWLPGGFVGVDVFFVISGYLITGILAREGDAGTFRYATFYERRVRRIYPALAVVLIATFIAGWFVLAPPQYRTFGRTLVWTPLFASNFAFMGQTGYFDPDAATKPLLHTWSLGVEEQYYILFPLLLGMARRAGIDRRRMIAAIVATSFAASVVSGAIGFDDGYFLLPMRFWEIGCGALLATSPLDRLSRGARAGLGAVGLGMVVFSMAWIDESLPFPGWVAALPVVGAVGVIAAGTGPAARLLSLAPMTFVGRISYPAYLWHWPLVVLTQSWFFHPLTPTEAVGVVAATIGLAWLTLAVIETPIRSRRILRDRRSLFAIAATMSLVLVAAGLFVFNAKGLDRWRSDRERAIAAFANQRSEIEDMCPEGPPRPNGDRSPCLLGLRGSEARAPQFALVGDSHARAAGGALSAVAASKGLTGQFFGRLGCAPVAGMDFEKPCADHVEQAVAWIERENIRRIVLVARWALPVTGHDYGNAPARLHPLEMNGRAVAETERAEAIRTGLATLLDRLAGRDVVIVASIPEVRFDVPNTVANALRLGREVPSGPSRREFEDRQRVVRAVLASAVAGRQNVHLLDPTDLFCDQDRCALLGTDGMPLYSDADHLTRAGARRLEPLFESALAGLERK